MSLDYFQRFLQAYDGSSKEVREQLKLAIMREKTTPMAVATYLCEALLDETDVRLRRAEINNLLFCSKGWLQQPERITQAVIDSIMNRIYYLITNPDSSGFHDLAK